MHALRGHVEPRCIFPRVLNFTSMQECSAPNSLNRRLQCRVILKYGNRFKKRIEEYVSFYFFVSLCLYESNWRNEILVWNIKFSRFFKVLVVQHFHDKFIITFYALFKKCEQWLGTERLYARCNTQYYTAKHCTIVTGVSFGGDIWVGAIRLVSLLKHPRIKVAGGILR